MTDAEIVAEGAANVMNGMAVEIGHLRERITDLTRERDEWQQAAQVEAGLVDEFKARAEAAEKERDEARKEWTSWKVLAERMRERNEAAEQRIADLTRKRDDAKSLFKKAFRELTRAKAEIAELSVRIDGAEVERDEWRLRGQAAEASRARAREALELADTALAVLIARTDEGRAVKSRAQAAICALADTDPAGRADQEAQS